MSQFQTNTLFGAVIIAILWYTFCVYILHIDAYVGWLWVTASICIWLWIGRNQKRLWFVGTVFTCLTVVWFLFSAIPVYNYSPSLDILHASQIPQIICDSSNSGKITVESTEVDMSDICKRGFFPILVNQTIKVNTRNPITIDLWLGNSASLAPATTSKIQLQDKNTAMPYTFSSSNWIEINNKLDSKHIAINQDYSIKKKDYLQKNFPWKREYAPSTTKIALRKMRLLSLIDRSYNDKVKNLEFYLQEVK